MLYSYLCQQQRLNDLEDIQRTLATIEQRLNEESPSTVNPCVEKSDASQETQNANEEVTTEKTVDENEQKLTAVQDSDTSATLSQESSNIDLNYLNSLAARLAELQRTKADIVRSILVWIPYNFALPLVQSGVVRG